MNLKRTEQIQVKFSNWNGIKPEVSDRKMSEKSPQLGNFNTLNNPQVQEEAAKGILKYFELNENENR